jgi:hypothetical protein
MITQEEWEIDAKIAESFASEDDERFMLLIKDIAKNSDNAAAKSEVIELVFSNVNIMRNG